MPRNGESIPSIYRINKDDWCSSGHRERHGRLCAAVASHCFLFGPLPSPLRSCLQTTCLGGAATRWKGAMKGVKQREDPAGVVEGGCDFVISDLAPPQSSATFASDRSPSLCAYITCYDTRCEKLATCVSSRIFYNTKTISQRGNS